MLVTITGLTIAILAGRPEAVVMTAPWTVLLILGFANAQPGEVDVGVSVDVERLIVGDVVEVTTTVGGISGLIDISCLPTEAFWPDTIDEESHGRGLVHDALRKGRPSVRVPLTAAQWGVHDVGRVALTVTEPYGLFRWSGYVDEPQHVRVHPRPSQIRSLVSPTLVRSVTGAHMSRLSGRGVEYADIRPFSSGDSLRDINWKASARSQDLWISLRHPDRATDVVLLLDSFIEPGHDVRTVLGLAIEGAIALADSHLGVSDRVGLVQLGGTVRWLSPGAGRHQLERITDQLLSSGLHSHTADRNLALIMSRALPPRSFVMALTPLLDDRFIEALFILIAHGHDVGVVECSAAPQELTDAHDTSARLAGRIWEAKRQVVRDRLLEQGIAVATWRRGSHLELTLAELQRRRRAVGRRRR